MMIVEILIIAFAAELHRAPSDSFGARIMSRVRASFCMPCPVGRYVIISRVRATAPSFVCVHAIVVIVRVSVRALLYVYWGRHIFSASRLEFCRLWVEPLSAWLWS